MKYKLVSPILMWLIILTGITIFNHLVSHTFIFSKNIFTSSLIIPAFIYWVYFFYNAIRENKRAALSADKVKKIISTGVYGIVRHPIYSADIIFGWALFFYYPVWWVLIGIIWLNVIMILWMTLEEKALTNKFHSDYIQYKHKVPMVIPCFLIKIFK